MSREREQSNLKLRPVRISHAPDKCYRLVTSFRSWGKISRFFRASRLVWVRKKSVAMLPVMKHCHAGNW